jgi:sirohydrochlorin cobaltochelatase
MNCLLCKYRERIIGHEAAVGAPQQGHHHHVEGIGTDAPDHYHHHHHHDHHDHHDQIADGATRPTRPLAVT